MYDTILVPTDGSEATTETLEHALDLARRHDATLHALYVVDERKYHAMPPDRRDEAKETLQRKGERAVDEIAMRADEVGVDATTVVREGVPSESIVQHAEGNDVDVVVIGTHGSADHERRVKLGSVTQRVVENGTVPVFVVHIEPETEVE
jgi:nucleotide-binding universal stress UspA family protein